MNLRALVVDDSTIPRKFLSSQLRNLWVNVSEAESFDEAILAVSTWTFDILVCDTNLDWMKCWIDVAKKFKKLNSNWIVVWISVENDNKNKWDWVADDFILKWKEDINSIFSNCKL